MNEVIDTSEIHKTTTQATNLSLYTIELKLLLGIPIKTKFIFNDKNFIKVLQRAEHHDISRLTLKLDVKKFKQFLIERNIPSSVINYYHNTTKDYEIIVFYTSKTSLQRIDALKNSILLFQETIDSNSGAFQNNAAVLASTMLEVTLSEYFAEIHKNKIKFETFYTFKYTTIPIMFLVIIIFVFILCCFILAFFHHNYIQ